MTSDVLSMEDSEFMERIAQWQEVALRLRSGEPEAGDALVTARELRRRMLVMRDVGHRDVQSLLRRLEWWIAGEERALASRATADKPKRRPGQVRHA